MEMRALFLAGGLGTRLRPLTDNLPKPMVPVMGKPLLERNIMKLKEYGVDEIIISACYKSQHLMDYFGDGSKCGVKIHYVCEDVPLGTGGAIKNTENFFDDTFLIFNSDIVTDINFEDFIRYHKEKSAAVTIAVTEVDNPCMYGVIEYDKEGYVISFKEKPKPHEVTSRCINAGVYAFEPEVLEEIPTGRPVSVEREVFPNLLRKGYKISIYRGCSYWIDIGTPSKYLQIHKDILAGKYIIPENDFSHRSVYKGKNVKIYNTAKIIGPVYIGDNVEIGPNVTIGRNTVIGNNVKIGMGSKIVGSVVWDNVIVGTGVKLINTIVASDCSIEHNIEYNNMIYTNNYEIAVVG